MLRGYGTPEEGRQGLWRRLTWLCEAHVGPRHVAGQVTSVWNYRAPLRPQRLTGRERKPVPQRGQQREKQGVHHLGESPSPVSQVPGDTGITTNKLFSRLRESL